MFLFFHDSTCAMCTFPSTTNNFAHAQTLSRMSSLSGSMNIARVSIECFTGCKRIKQRRISFVLGYLRMILWKLSTAISIKHRLLATFNIKNKSILTALYAFIPVILLVFMLQIIYTTVFRVKRLNNLTFRVRCFNRLTQKARDC